MSFFPASHSILSAESLISFLEKKYSFKGKSNCKLIKNWVNDSYLISDNLNRYILRIYRHGWRSREEVQAEINVVLLLKEKDVSVSFPIADKNDEYVQEFDAIEGTRFGVLFSFAKGEKPNTNSKELEFEIGQLIANIHLHTEGLNKNRIDYSIKFLLDDSIEKIGKRLSNSSEEFLFLKIFQQYFYKEIENIDYESFRKGIVHLDIWRDNLHQDSNNGITLFDFDFCGNGWLILDLAFHAIVVFITESNLEKYESEMKTFYKGYENVTPLNEKEKKAIPLLATCTLIYYLAFQSERFAAIYANEDYLKLVVNQRIKRWVNYCDLPVSSIDIS